MDDDFYEPLSASSYVEPSSRSLFSPLDIISSPPLLILGTILLALPLIFIAIRPNGGSSEVSDDRKKNTVWMLPGSTPVVGHWLQFLYDPTRLMSEARDRSAHSIFALKLGNTTHNIISNPTLSESAVQKGESILQPQPDAWDILRKGFGVPKRCKGQYALVWEKLQTTLEYLMEEPHLTNNLGSMVRNLEQSIPQMISFVDGDVDQHSWERSANASYISDSETEIDLLNLMQGILSTASTPTIFGSGLLEKYPNLIHDLHDMEAGMPYFMMGFPAWTPSPSIGRAYLARQRVLWAMDSFQEALDALVDDKPVDLSWGDLDDVSEFIMKRHAIYKENGFGVTERAEISVLWALVVNADLAAYWHLLYILATPGLVDRIHAEIAPYAQVTQPESIGSFAEAPKLSLSYEGLSKKCPLLKATYFEAMRLSARPSSTQKITSDVTISEDAQGLKSSSYILHKGEYVRISHDLHMRDPKYFEDPDTFEPERFLVQNSDGTQSAEMGTMRPYGSGASICKGRDFAERECLSFVAGMLAVWDIQPANKKTGWVIPRKKASSTVCRPVHDTRVRIKQRAFKWDK